MSELPKGWTTTKFTEVLDISGGTQPPKSEFIPAHQDGYIRLLQIRDFGEKPVPTFIPDNGKRKTCRKDDVLIGRYGASIGRICTGMEGAYNVALAKVIKPDFIDGGFLKYYLMSENFQQPLRLLSRSAQNGFNKKDLSNFDFVYPSLKEQKRIGYKLDSVLAKVEAAQARLDKIPAILKRFRQSVLAAATSGELTSDWREENQIGLDTWREENLREVAECLDPNPSHRYPTADSQGVPILSTQQFVGLESWTTDKAKVVSREFFLERQKKTRFLESDIIFARKGRLGLARMAPKGFDFVYSHTVFIVRAMDVSVDYLLWFLRQDKVINWLLQEMNSNTGVPTLGKAVFEKLPIQIPSKSEQQIIVSKIKKLFEIADVVEKQYEFAKLRLDKLSQSILSKAFKGELSTISVELEADIAEQLTKLEAV